MSKRADRIMEILTNETKIEVSLLAEKLGVSQVTVRKDLDALENMGIVTREHGYALLRSTDDLNSRIAYHYEAKKRIAKKAAEQISNGDTLMIESGSCCALLADALAETKKNLTIITNSAYIAGYIRGKSNFQLILLGGIYQEDAQVMVGPMIRQCADNFCVDLFFIGTDGYSARTGFTNRDQMRAQAVRDMAHQVEQVVVLTESEKFNRHGVVPLNLQGLIRQVITDSQIELSVKTELENQGIKIITV